MALVIGMVYRMVVNVTSMFTNSGMSPTDSSNYTNQKAKADSSFQDLFA